MELNKNTGRPERMSNEANDELTKGRGDDNE